MDETAFSLARSAGGIFALAMLVACASAELGYRLGLRVFSQGGESERRTIGGIQGAILGLLGLLLGFTFAMSVGRYDARRTLVVQEANAIGTTFLRASLLPQEHVQPVQDLLRRYVRVRIEHLGQAVDSAGLNEALAQSATLQTQLWNHAVAAAREAPTAPVVSFITALNETIDSEAERVAAARARIPVSVWLLLLLVASFGCLTSSYAAGAEGVRSAFSSLLLPLLVAVVVTLIYDLANPLRGFIGVSQQPLVDLARSIAPPGG